MSTDVPRPTAQVPVHFLGLSQIASYGLLFYLFAQISEPLGAHYGVSATYILFGVSCILCLQAPLAPFIGSWIDRYGALRVLSIGLAVGAVGLFVLGWSTHLVGFWCCIGLIGFASGASQYEVAFAAAVQILDLQARQAISVITFYGGVASSIVWLSVAPLLEWIPTDQLLLFLAIPLCGGSVWAWQISTRMREPTSQQSKQSSQVPFRWRLLEAHQKKALVWLSVAGSLESLVFAATSLMWITWFTRQFDDPGLAVFLASLYGPFQVVGRLLELRYGRRYDARRSGLVAFLCLPVALASAMVDSIPAAAVAMVLFGIGHGVLSITFGYVVSLFFESQVYGRAKSWIATPKAIAASAGPLLAGLLYALAPDLFLPVGLCVICIGCLVFVKLLSLPTRRSPSSGLSETS